MRIGIISDTHNHLPESIFNALRDVDMIIHAGDIGTESILVELETIAPVRAIFGNTDTFPLVSRLRRMEFFKVNNTRICLIHAIRSVKSFSYELFKMGQEADVVIYGHTHNSSMTEYHKTLYINPGSASFPRHGAKGSVAILTLSDGEKNVEFITL